MLLKDNTVVGLNIVLYHLSIVVCKAIILKPDSF